MLVNGAIQGGILNAVTAQATSVEVAPGLLVVFYADGQVEIASNFEFHQRKGSEPYGGPGNVFLPLILFTRLQDIPFPRAYPRENPWRGHRWRHRLDFWWKFSSLRFYFCLLAHRKYRWNHDGNLESACEKCYLQK